VPIPRRSDDQFVSGRELSRRFYVEAVRPVLDSDFPGLPHSAALLGRGSEVLGYDDAMSRDHNWEPRVVLFLTEEDQLRHGETISATLGRKLPERFADHRSDHQVTTLRHYLRAQLDLDLDHEVDVRDWLSISEQQLLMITAGAVYHDEVGLRVVRDRLSYYPHDVWLYLMLAGWWRIHPEANLAGRAGSVGDELGSSVIGAVLVRDLMRLCFLIERRYAPYAKWFGTAFARLDCAEQLAPVLTRVLRSGTWQDREQALVAAYAQVAGMHNALGITAPVQTEVHQLWDRPFGVLWGDFPAALKQSIRDPAVREIAERFPVGGVDQFREIIPAARMRKKVRALLS
jgi:hypothetical protein